MSRTTQRTASLSALRLIVAATGVLAWLWGMHKLLNQDEMFVLQTDSVHSLAEVLRIQLHYPISLDPIAYHALVHFCLRTFGAHAFALRLPSLLGYMLMQFCIFLFVRRAANATMSGEQAVYVANVAAVLPLGTATLFYAAEARPYGLLLGLYALAIFAWQSATRDAATRRWSLPVLAIAVALALNAHYFAILLLPVLYLAELVRTAERRRIDLPLLAALLLGTACIVFTLPFQKAARQFRTHYYNAGNVSGRAITQAYRSLFVDYTTASLRTQHYAAVLFVALAIVFLVALVMRWRTLALPRAEAVLLLTLCALPFFGFGLARFVTHSYEVRYVLGAIIGITILMGLLLAPWLAPRGASSRRQVWITGLICIVVLAAAWSNIRREQSKSEATMKSLQVPASVRAALLADPNHNLYIQQMGHYEVAQYYQPDAFLRAHTVLVYSGAREIFFDRHDTEALTAEHMTHFTSLPIVRYEDLTQDPRPHVWLLYDSGWDFTKGALSEDQAQLTPIAPWVEGTAAIVQFPKQP